MNKKDVKRILISMRTTENKDQVDNLLGKIDVLPEEKLQAMVIEIGDNEESIRKYLEGKLCKIHNNGQDEHTPINDMFTYGISDDCIHLHMPVDLRTIIPEKGRKKTVDTVKLYLLDALERIRRLQNEGYYKFDGKDSIYMISPILVGREMKFFDELDFETHSYKKKELQSEEFVKSHQEAQLAVYIFGKERNVGTAKISLDVINSQQWQNKRIQKVKEFEKQGITLNKNDKIKE